MGWSRLSAKAARAMASSLAARGSWNSSSYRLTGRPNTLWQDRLKRSALSREEVGEVG